MEDGVTKVQKKVRNGFDYEGDPTVVTVTDMAFDESVAAVAGVKVGDPLASMAKQSFADECNINYIMRRYEATGDLSPFMARVPPKFGDFVDAFSYQESMNIVLDADRQFSQLPAELRARFGNDPAQMLAFLENEENRAEAEELGLVRRPDPPAPPMEVRVVPDPVPPKPAEPAKPA